MRGREQRSSSSGREGGYTRRILLCAKVSEGGDHSSIYYNIDYTRGLQQQSLGSQDVMVAFHGCAVD